MAANPMAQLVQYLRKAAILQEGEGFNDAVLLGTFIGQRDGASFEALMRRHGPMVLGVCRRILGNVHDADDAFQATFLVLVRKAASIRKREAVGNWLHGVAHRTALETRRANARRGALEKQVPHMPHPQVQPRESWHELEPVLDQELSSLPEKYRLPVVLCDLEGRTRKHVARQLGIPEGTLSNRLATARKMLAKRLTRHGFGLSSAALAVLISENAASAGLPLSLVGATVKAAMALTTGNIALSGLVSVQVAVITEGVLKAMLISKIKLVGVALLTMCVIGLGTGKIISQGIVDKLGSAAKVRWVPGKPDTIEVPKEMHTQLGIQVGQIKARGEEKPMMPPLIGTLNFDNDRLFTLRSRFPGEVAEIRRTIDTNTPGTPTQPRPMRIGDMVKQGDLLAVIWSQQLGTAKAALVGAIIAQGKSKEGLCT